MLLTKFRNSYLPARSVRTALLLTAALASTGVHAEAPDILPDAYRLQHSVGKFSDTTEFAAEWHFAAPQLLRAKRLELAVGTLADGVVTRPFLSIGPAWRWNFASRSYLDFGFSPTFLSDATVDDRSLGGHLHFTSSLSIGRRFGRYEQFSIAFRAQHVSNGGLDDKNPGINVAGLRFAWELRD